MGAAYQRGLILHRQRRFELAVEEFTKELAEKPNDAHPQAMLAMTYAELQTPKLAREAAAAAITALPTYAFAHYAMAYATYRQQQIELLEARKRGEKVSSQLEDYRIVVVRAIPHVMEAIRLEPRNADFLAMHAGLLLDLDYFPTALDLANRGLQCNPRHSGCANIRAHALRRLGRAEEAKETLRQAVAINPEHATTQANLGWTSIRDRNYAQAAEHFTQALRLNPMDDVAEKGLKTAQRAQNPYVGFLLRMHRRRSRRTKFVVILIGLLLGWLYGMGASPSTADSAPQDGASVIAVLAMCLFLSLLLVNLVLRIWKRLTRPRAVGAVTQKIGSEH
jgi:tetratricopeptide (TPR) repeat protein